MKAQNDNFSGTQAFDSSRSAEAGGTLRQRLVEELRAQIESGELSPGDRLLSLTDLSLHYKVSNITARAALRELIASGYVESRPRSGYFVRHVRPQEQNLSDKNMIALLLPNGDEPYEASLVRGVMEQCEASGYRVLLTNSGDEAVREAEQLQQLSRQVGGIVIFPAHDSQHNAVYADLLRRKVPFIFVDRSVPDVPAPLVATDNMRGGYLATEHLLGLGRRRNYILHPSRVSATWERLLGYRAAMAAANAETHSSLERESPLHTRAVGYILGQEVMEIELARQPFEPFGIFASTENVASTCYMAIKEAGLRIPEDVAIASYDDVAAAFFDPPLTVVRQEPYRMGQLAAEKLLKIMHGVDAFDATEIRLEPELIVRNSTDVDSKFNLLTDLMSDVGENNSAVVQPLAGAHSD
jgi:LacI family transcriptional regulator